jgi:hemolysin III
MQATKETAAERRGVGGRPFLRGRLHEAAFWMSVAAGPALVVAAPAGHRAAVAVYAVTLAALLGTSALYHRITWQPRARLVMRRLDHSMIFLLIAGTYTAVAPLALAPPASTRLLTAVWVLAVAGIAFSVAWPTAPKPVTAAIILAIGWVALAALPSLETGLPTAAFALLIAGGVAYSAGAIIYALKRPNPFPRVAGYHEVFHALVVLAAAAHYGTVALALP